MVRGLSTRTNIPTYKSSLLPRHVPNSPSQQPIYTETTSHSSSIQTVSHLHHKLHPSLTMLAKSILSTALLLASALSAAAQGLTAVDITMIDDPTRSAPTARSTSMAPSPPTQFPFKGVIPSMPIPTLYIGCEPKLRSPHQAISRSASGPTSGLECLLKIGVPAKDRGSIMSSMVPIMSIIPTCLRLGSRIGG